MGTPSSLAVPGLGLPRGRDACVSAGGAALTAQLEGQLAVQAGVLLPQQEAFSWLPGWTEQEGEEQANLLPL